MKIQQDANIDQIIPGYNDLATLYPEIAATWSSDNEGTPDTVLPTSNMIYAWICPNCRRKYYATVHMCIKNGCPYDRTGMAE